LFFSLKTPDAGSEVPEIVAWVASCPGHPLQHEDIERRMPVAMGSGYCLESLSIWPDHPQLPQLPWIWMSRRPRHLQACTVHAAKRGTPPGPSHRDPSERRVRAPNMVSIASSHPLPSWFACALGSAAPRCSISIITTETAPAQTVKNLPRDTTLRTVSSSGPSSNPALAATRPPHTQTNKPKTEHPSTSVSATSRRRQNPHRRFQVNLN
jgi:hypothetical protein